MHFHLYVYAHFLNGEQHPHTLINMVQQLVMKLNPLTCLETKTLHTVINKIQPDTNSSTDLFGNQNASYTDQYGNSTGHATQSTDLFGNLLQHNLLTCLETKIILTNMVTLQVPHQLQQTFLGIKQ